MRVALFFICLCYLLFGGYNYLYTGSHGYAPALHLEKNHAKFTGSKQTGAEVKQAAPGEPDAYLLEDIEDEDSNESFARKFKLLTSYLYNLTIAGLLACLYSRFKAHRPHIRLLANKYITQRVMRI